MAQKTIKLVKLHGKYHYRCGRFTGRELPWLNLSGVWLEKAGFAVDQAIEVTVSRRKLIIKAI
jgi:toxic protein SymE